MKPALKYVLLLFVLLAGCHSDQYAKHLARESLKDRPALIVLSGFAELCYAENTGAAFNMLDDLHSAVRRPLLVGVPLLGMLAAAGCFWRLRSRPFSLLLPFALILAGASGNLLDRLRYGYVIDFVHVHAGDLFHWPVFNVADTLLFIGGLTLVLQYAFARGGRSSQQAHAGQR